MFSIQRIKPVFIFMFFTVCSLLMVGCVKDPVLPSVATQDAENIGVNNATVAGRVMDDGGATITSRGICWGTASEPTINDSFKASGTGKGEFSCDLTGLNPNTEYHARAFAENSVGISYGNEILFTTGIAAPAVTTGQITAITNTSAVCSGTVTYDGGAPDTERGICWGTSPNPDLSGLFSKASTGTGSYTVAISNQEQGTRYYVRAYVKNAGGTVYGEQVTFHTKIADIEGNLYGTITIGTQVWMTENLRTATYNDHNPIPNVQDNNQWITTTTPAYSWWRNDIAYKNSFGALYNWYAVENGKLCPTGWHVPSDNEFKELEIFLGMTPADASAWEWRGTDQGYQMKSTTSWNDNGNGSNSSGFNGICGGYRFGGTGAFNALGMITYWWTSDPDGEQAVYRRLDFDNNKVHRSVTSKKGGKYIRCVKN